MPNRFDLHRQREVLRKQLQTLPVKVGDIAVNFFKARFREQGWRNVYLKGWKQRSPKAKRNKGRAILIDSGRLRRSIRIAKINAMEVTIGTDVPYARMHNEGFKGTVQVKAHTRGRFAKRKTGTGKFTKTGKERMKTVTERTGDIPVRAHSRRINMPQRRFIGESKYLTRLIHHKIHSELLKAFQ